MTLPDLWFGLVAFFWVGYLVLEGFDFGVGMLLPFLGRDDEEREELIDTIGPVWDGNEVWLIVAGGATFAAFPVWYAGLFSAAYVWLVLALLALILRAVSFEWGHRGAHERWRGAWMWANAAGSLLVPFLWGVALSALLKGLPFNASQDFTGSPLDFLSWYSVLGGVTLVALCLLNGATFLTIKTGPVLAERARAAGRRLAPLAVVLGLGFLTATVLVGRDVNGGDLLPGLVPAIVGAVALVDALILSRIGRGGWAFVATVVGVAMVTATLFVTLFPNVIVSSTGAAYDLTVSNSSSAHYTLTVMTVAAVVLAPVVLAYQAWTYWVFRRRTTGGPPPAPAAPEG